MISLLIQKLEIVDDNEGTCGSFVFENIEDIVGVDVLVTVTMDVGELSGSCPHFFEG